MATLRVTAIVPALNDGGTPVSTSTYQTAMESIATDGRTELDGQLAFNVGNNFDSYYQRISHYIVDTNLATATTNYNNLVASITKSGMTCHFFSIVMNSFS